MIYNWKHKFNRMSLQEIAACAERINKGERVYTSSEQVMLEIIDWYRKWGTTIENKKEGDGFWLWNPEKQKKT